MEMLKSLFQELKPALQKAADYAKKPEEAGANLKSYEELLNKYEEKKLALQKEADANGVPGGTDPLLSSSNEGSGAEMYEEIHYSSRLIEKMCKDSEILNRLP